MNIEINPQQFQDLQDKIICSLSVGSTLYGLNTKFSDRDVLHIYQDDKAVTTFHQLIYKENQTDHLLCTLSQFIENIISGDCLINFEALHSLDFAKCEKLKFLYDHRQEFYTFQLVRAYLGFARRDLKNFKSSKNKNKLFHAFRGKTCAVKLLEEQSYENHYQSFDAITQNMLYKLKNQTFLPEQELALAEALDKEIEEARKLLIEKHNKHEIRQSISSEFRKQLDSWLIGEG